MARQQRVGGDGVPEVFCADEQIDVRVDLERWQQLAFDVAEASFNRITVDAKTSEWAKVALDRMLAVPGKTHRD